MFFHALLFVLHHYGGNAHSGAAFLDTEKVPFTAGENEEGQVTKKYGFWIVGAALIILNGCGSTGGSSYTGSIYETNPPLDVSTIAGTAGVFGSADGTGPTAQFGQPDGVVLSPDGTTLYVADFGNSTIRKMDLSTGAVTTIAGSAGDIGTADGTGPAARFNGPAYITTDGNRLFVADAYNNSIRQIVIENGAVTTLAGSTSGVAGAVDGTGTAARFFGPEGITITPDGTTLYVADYYNNTIRRIVIASGAVTTMATNAQITYPAGIVCDGTGTNLYLTDFGYNLIRQIVISSGVVSTLAGNGMYGSVDGTGSTASFNQPNSITLLGANIYVADSSNHLIRKIVIATGAVTTVAGGAGIPGSIDGSGAGARFFSPVGITTDGTNLYVGDAYNGTIRKIQ
jgi:DNA-binding beta-propeller fold protein YncE